MRTITPLCGGLVLFGFCAGALGAPEAISTLPPGRLLQKMGGNSAMQITYSYSSEEEKSTSPSGAAAADVRPAPTLFPTSPIRLLTLTRTMPLWHAVRLDVNGNSVEQWYDGNDYYYMASGILQPMLENPSPASESGAADSLNPTGFPDFKQVDFPDMEWVSAGTYAGIEVVEGHKCLVFKKDDQKAWIDLETRFPVQWQRGKEKRSFQELPPPAQMLVLPPKIARIAAAMKHDRDKWANLVVPSNKK